MTDIKLVPRISSRIVYFHQYFCPQTNRETPFTEGRGGESGFDLQSVFLGESPFSEESSPISLWEEKGMKYRLGRYIVTLVVASLVCIAYVWPQAGTGELTGLVTDPAGGVIVGAAIELTNNATGAVRTTVTSDAGIYRFVSLPVIGKYTLHGWLDVPGPGVRRYLCAGSLSSE